MNKPRVAVRKFDSIDAIKASLKKGASSGVTFIKHVPEDGIVVRFITEPEEWFGYQEYYDVENKQFVPMVEGEILPDGTRPSFRYLANVVDVTEDRVIPLKLPKTLANLLMIKYEKYGSMTDRNYELDRHGTGLDTTYDSTPQTPSKMNTKKFDVVDLGEILETARRIAEGEDPFDTESPITLGEDVDDSDDEEFSDDVLYPEGAWREDYSKAELKAIEADEMLGELAEWWELEDSATISDILEAQGGEEEDDSDDDEEDKEELVIDEDELEEMTLRQLRAIADQLGVDHTGVKKDNLVDAIIEAAEE